MSEIPAPVRRAPRSHPPRIQIHPLQMSDSFRFTLRVVGHALRPRSDLGARNRLCVGSRIGWDTLSDQFAVNGTDGGGTGEDQGDEDARFAAAIGWSISGTVFPWLGERGVGRRRGRRRCSLAEQSPRVPAGRIRRAEWVRLHATAGESSKESREKGGRRRRKTVLRIQIPVLR